MAASMIRGAMPVLGALGWRRAAPVLRRVAPILRCGGPVLRCAVVAVLAALCALLPAVAGAQGASGAPGGGLWAQAAAQSGQLTVSVDRSSVPAEGGSVRVTVRIAQSAVLGAALGAGAAAEAPMVTLTTDLGSFGADSGPSRVVLRPMSGADGGAPSASVRLVGDGQPGLAVITARAGSAVDAVTVAFIGAPAEIVILRPARGRPLDASRAHVVQLEVRDRLGQPVPGAPLRLEATADAAPTLRSALGERGPLLALRTLDNGRATATLSAAPGETRLRAVSVEAEVELALVFHGAPARLRLWALNSVLERGSETAVAIVLARIVDDGGRAVPERRISFNVHGESGESDILLTVEGERGEPITDAGGSVLTRARAQAAQTGSHWLRAEAGGGLSDVVELTVVGKPETIYVTATQIDMLERAGGEFDEYLLRAEVVDPAGRAVAPGYAVRWRVLLDGGESALSSETSAVRDGVATVRLRLENAVGEPVLQALLIEAPQVNTEGRLTDLAAPGLALRPGLNVVTWMGGETTVDAAIAPIAHLRTTVWREHPEGAGWLSYTTGGAASEDASEEAPQDDPQAASQAASHAAFLSEPFAIDDGVRLHIRVEAAARLPGVAR